MSFTSLAITLIFIGVLKWQLLLAPVLYTVVFRIAITRALLTDPRILIVDDSTSAIDSATEDEIQKAMRRVLRDGRRCLSRTVCHRYLGPTRFWY